MSSAILEFKHLSRHFVLRVLVLVLWYKQNVFNGDLVQRARATLFTDSNTLYKTDLVSRVIVRVDRSLC